MRGSRYFFTLSLLGLLSGACSSSEQGLSPSANLDPDVAPVTSGSWYQPPVSTTWQIQLTGTINTSYAVDAYDVDLFDTPNTVFTTLHGASRKVICYFSAGSSEDWRDDYGDFLETSKGEDMDGWPGEKWVDIRSQNVLDITLARLDYAVERGCDGVDPDNVNGYTNDTGFDLTATDQKAFNRRIANEARERGLFVVLKNDGDQVSDLLAYFDGVVNESCHEYSECDDYYPFVTDGKPVFNIEYTSTGSTCTTALGEDFRTLIMPLDLDDSSRVSCD